jgi:hypothetical protein
MPQHVIERDVRGAGTPSPENQWVQSCITDDRTYWVRISNVRTIDPTTDDGSA